MKEKSNSLLKYIGVIFSILFSITIIKVGYDYFQLNNNYIGGTLLQKDSDGDGLSDKYENRLFNSQGSTFKYNKNISDLPHIEATVASQPFLIIDEEVIETTTGTESIEVGNSLTKSREVIHKVDVRASAGWSGSIVPSISIEGGYSRESKTSQVSVNSTTQTSSNTREVQYTLKQGKLVCPIFIKNYGNLPATIQNITLTSVIYDETGTAVFSGTLVFDGDEFPTLNLEGNSDRILLNFVDEDLFSEEIDLLSSVHGEIDVSVVSIDLSTPLVSNYIKQKSLVKSKSARVIFSGVNPSYYDLYDVTVKENYTLENIASDMGLVIEYKDDWIYKINGNRADQTFDFSTWVIRHVGQRNGINISEKFSINAPIALKDVPVNKGDILYFYKESSNDVLRLNDSNMLKAAYSYHFTNNNESIVQNIATNDGSELYILPNVRDFSRIDDFYNYKSYDLDYDDLIALYYEEFNDLIMVKYQEALDSDGPDPAQCLQIAKRQVERLHPKSKWIDNYINNNELVLVEKAHGEYSPAKYRSAYYDYLIKNEIKSLSEKNSRVLVKLNKPNSEELTFKIDPGKLATIQKILVNGIPFDIELIDKKASEITIKSPDNIELYSQQISQNAIGNLRLIERFEFE